MTWSVGNLIFVSSLALVAGGPLAFDCATAAASDPGIYTKAIYSKVLTLDPAKMTDTASLSVANQIYEGLLEFGSHFEIQPALAETWQTSDDGKTMTFRLRSAVTFQDGSPVTAADCVRSFERLLAKGSIVSKYYDLIDGAADYRAGRADHVRGLVAPDSRTFVIHLKNKFPPFAAVLAGATAKILPRAEVDHPGFFSHPIGAGPFKLISSNLREIVLTRFDGYWRGPAKLKELRFLVGDEKQGIDAAARGEVQDLVTYPLNGDEPIFREGQHLQIPVVATWLIGLNTRLKPFNRRDVRTAFRAAFSPEDFVKTFYPGQIPASGGYFPPGLPGYIPPVTKIKKVAPKVAISTPIKIAVPVELEKGTAIKSYLETTFRKAGFNVTVELMPWDELQRGYNAKTMQAFLISMNADYPDVEFLARNFESDNPDNFSGIHSKVIDALIRAARVTDSRPERDRLYEKLARVLNDEALTVNLFHYRAHYWFADCVRGVELNSLGDVYIPYRDIYLSGSCGSAKVAEAKP